MSETTPDAISAKELSKLADEASDREEKDRLKELMTMGHDLVEIVADEGRYDDFDEVQALALQASWNLMGSYKRALKKMINDDRISQKQIIQCMRAYTQAETAFDILKDTAI